MELTAKSIPKRRQVSSGGLESLFEAIGIFFIVAGVLLAMSLFFVIGIIAIVPSLQITVFSFLLWLLLRFFAEVIRLLKRQAGMEYEGRISGKHEEEVIASCSNCGAMLHSDVACDQCGARLIKPGEE